MQLFPQNKLFPKTATEGNLIFSKKSYKNISVLQKIVFIFSFVGYTTALEGTASRTENAFYYPKLN
jgi:hypothetical protein